MRKWLIPLFLLLGTTVSHADSVVLQTCDTLPPSYQPGGTRPDTIDTNGFRCGRVRQDESQIFYEDWSNGVIDTANVWNAATTGGNGSSTPSSGNEALSSGTTANGFAMLTSAVFFQPVAPGFLLYDHQFQLPTTFPAHTYAFWGAGRMPASPTVTNPVVEGIGFFLTTTGALQATTYQTNTINVIATIPAAQVPRDGGVHRYQIRFRGDQMYWLIDGNLVANLQNGALGPNNNNLAVAMLSGVDATGSASSLVANSAAVFIGDSTKDAFQFRDPCSRSTKRGAAINLTASGQIITGATGKKTYICSINMISATAQNIALVEGTGSVCATNIFGLAGGTTAATGWNLAANTGIQMSGGAGTVISASADTNALGANVCLLLSGTGQTSGQITFVQAP